ncbi:F-box protein CPR1-like [Punica granatum]|uniref:F-box protein CPR1-like n=1 Tax=Punica granatum TaxID=22663 RepID=A0A6P8E1J2_PUNGR|nr:F-box protein CPR1-like [Punica granatum]
MADGGGIESRGSSTVAGAYVIPDILLRLPMKTLMLCKYVSKPWCDLIRSPAFVAAHLRHSSHLGRGYHLQMPQVSESPFIDDPVLPPGWDLTHPDLCSLASESTFAKRGTVPVTIDPNSHAFQIVGSVNGQICISRLHPREAFCPFFRHWNPSIRKLENLGNERFEVKFTCQSGITISRFGYDPESDSYKVVRIT